MHCPVPLGRCCRPTCRNLWRRETPQPFPCEARRGYPGFRLVGEEDFLEYGIDVGPGAMPQATFEVVVWLDARPNSRGWLFGSEDSGCDRYILMHDGRVGGVAGSCMGMEGRTGGGGGLGEPPVGEWLHVVAT